MKQNKNALTRTCAGCGGKINKYNLIRVVRDPDGYVFVDDSLKANGRGAYICKNKECLRKLKKTGRLSRVLKCEVPAEVYSKLEEIIGE